MIKKYFIAIVPNESLSEEIKQIKQEIFATHGIKGALLSPAHITLHMPFNWEEEKEEKLINCLANFHHNTNITITTHGFSAFEPRVVFIDIIQELELFELQKKLVKHVKTYLQLFNQSDDLRGFHPHITIAFRDLKKPQFYAIWEEFKIKHFNKQFNCNTICLLKHNNSSWEVYKEFAFDHK
jgi:2'-5' RNA ligase